jgi:hypothetical protein
VLGQAVVPGTTAGYVVAANGQALKSLYTGSGTVPGATVNGPQVGVGQNVTSWNPCVMLGLTPALIAQFRPMNTLPWTGLGSGPLGNGTMVPAFPNSNAPAGLQFGVNLNYTVATPSLGTKHYNNQPTLLDTGTPTYQFVSNSIPFSFVAQGGSVTMSGTAAGAATITNQIVPTGSFPYVAPYQAEFTSLTPPSPPNPPTAENTIGIGFFLQNSMLFNRAEAVHREAVAAQALDHPRLPRSQERRRLVTGGDVASFRDWGAEQTAFSHDVLEMALAHATGDATVRAYKRTKELPKRRMLMDAWAAYCLTPAVEGDNVVGIRR